jgi:hypothetical protein
MISIKYIWDRIVAYSGKYQSGADPVSYFNSSIAEVQAEIFNDFSPYYGKNEKIDSLMDFWVRSQTGTAASDGTVSIGVDPGVVNRILSAG